MDDIRRATDLAYKAVSGGQRPVLPIDVWLEAGVRPTSPPRPPQVGC